MRIAVSHPDADHPIAGVPFHVGPVFDSVDAARAFIPHVENEWPAADGYVVGVVVFNGTDWIEAS